MDIPVVVSLDDECSTTWLLERFHPQGLKCPRCSAGMCRSRFFRRTKRSRLDVYRCYDCGQTHNLYTGTVFEGKHLRPSQVVLLLLGLKEEKSNPALANELGISRTAVYYLRRQLQDSQDLLYLKGKK